MDTVNVRKIKNWKAKTAQERLAVVLLKHLHKNGFVRSFIVGGFVRDLLLGKKDTGAIDIATEARPKQVEKLFSKKYRVIPTGLKHGTVTIHKGASDIEITTFRKEGKYLDSRRPSKVSFIKSPKTDAARRDFTINAFYFNPISREVNDYGSGFDDLRKKIIRFVGQPEKRILEDSLRLIRAVRFSTTLDFKIPSRDRNAIISKSNRIGKISPERIKTELDKIMLSPNRREGILMLYDFGLLKRIVPELAACAKTPQSKNFHSEGDVLAHTLLALESVGGQSDPCVLYGILFHDIGKSKTYKWTRRNGRPHVTFYNHQQVGMEMTRKILKRLRFSNSEIQDICWYVKNHLVPFELPKMRVSKQMAWALNPHFEGLLSVFCADTQASIPTNKKGKALKPSLSGYAYGLRLLKKARSLPALKKPLVSGHDVIKIFKIKPGPKVGEALAKVRQQQLAGKLKNKKEAFEFLQLEKDQQKKFSH